MGNCLESSRGRHGFGGGDDGAALHCGTEKKRAVLVEAAAAAAAAAAEEEKLQKGEKVTEVKIRITRKQLEELLRRLEEGKDGDGGGAVVSELLCMTSSCDFRHRAEQWRPSLQVIPE